MIRSSKHNIRLSNTGKHQILIAFLAEYRTALQISIDHIWSLETEALDIKRDKLELPVYLNYKDVKYQGLLSARAFCSAFEQAIDIVRGTIQKRKQLLFVLSKLLKEGKRTEYIERQLQKYQLVKPIVSEHIPAQLSSKCIDFETSSKHFDIFVRIKSTGFDHIKLPIKYSKTFKKRNVWKLLTGVAVHQDYIEFRQETKAPELKTQGISVGADTGIRKSITFSDGQSSNTNSHGHNLETISTLLARKTKGSKSFGRAQEHRKNYINWSINQLDLSNIKEINLEKINTFTGSRSRYLSHFAHSLISSKLMLRGEECGVRINLKQNVYKSQRCSGCGMVRKANRKGSLYCCASCELQIDADLNSALNNNLDLPVVPYWLRQQELNRKGFRWLPSGFWDLAGQELRVPDTEQS